MPGLKKLGLDHLPDAVACAQYHYFSNALGGVKPNSCRRASARRGCAIRRRDGSGRVRPFAAYRPRSTKPCFMAGTDTTAFLSATRVWGSSVQARRLKVRRALKVITSIMAARFPKRSAFVSRRMNMRRISTLPRRRARQHELARGTLEEGRARLCDGICAIAHSDNARSFRA